MIKKEDIILKFTIPGQPIPKKNGKGLSFFYKDKMGRKILRPKPVPYYTKQYTEWVKDAVQACAIFKNNMTIKGFDFPIMHTINLMMLFFVKDFRNVDVSNLYQGPEDVMSGNAGELGTSVPPVTFQILGDDNYKIVGSHDGSRVFYDNKNPRTMIYITKHYTTPWE